MKETKPKRPLQKYQGPQCGTWSVKIATRSWAVVAHALNPNTWEAEAGGFLSSRLAWSTELVPGQPGLHRELCLENTKQNKTKQNKTKRNKEH